MTRDEAFTACLLIYGPRPAFGRQIGKKGFGLESSLAVMFEWDDNVTSYLGEELGVTYWPDRMRLQDEFLEWLKGEGDVPE